MKTVLLIRHTKSDWSNGLPDFDRPIREDKKADTQLIAKEIATQNAIPQHIICSNAKRTLQTAKILCEQWDYPFKAIEKEPSLYEGAVSDLLNAIHMAPAKYDHIALICHNPAITYFVNQYGNTPIANVPTTGAICISFDVKEWADIHTTGKTDWFLAPKELRG